MKFTLLGSGQEEMRAGLSWCRVLQNERREKLMTKLIPVKVRVLEMRFG